MGFLATRWDINGTFGTQEGVEAIGNRKGNFSLSPNKVRGYFKICEGQEETGISCSTTISKNN